MLVFCDRNLDHTSDEVRDHPWTTSASDPAARFHDFRGKAEIVKEKLEDFRPFVKWPAIDLFYNLVEWVNSAESTLESNDSAFRGPRPNDDPRFAGSLKCSGRLMMFYRELKHNLREDAFEWLNNHLAQRLFEKNTGFTDGAIGLSRLPTRFLELPLDASGDEESRIGWILMVSFWAFGNTEKEVFENLARLFSILTVSVYQTSEQVKQILVM